MKLAQHRKMDHFIFWPLSVAVILVWIIVVGQGVYAYEYDYKIFPGAHMGTHDFSGMDAPEARAVLERYRDGLETQGFSFIFMALDGTERAVTVYPFIYEEKKRKKFLDFDVESTLTELFAVGRRGTFFERWEERVAARSFGVMVKPAVMVDRAVFEEALSANLKPDERPAQNASIVRRGGVYVVTAEVEGVRYPVSDKIALALERVSRLENEPLRMAAVFDTPAVVRADVAPFVPWLDDVAALGGVAISYTNEQQKKSYSWEISSSVLKESLAVRMTDGGARLALAGGEYDAWFAEEIAPQVELQVRDAIFDISTDGTRVEHFVSGLDGVAVNKEQLAEHISRVLHDRYERLVRGLLAVGTSAQDNKAALHETEILLSVDRSAPAISTGQSNELGIREILGAGVSNFSGSPHNRILNIRNAVKKLDGLLIAPGEEFSLLAALRPFNYANGYLKELVIKGDEIKPEIAGGLCQVGTTSFRMAMNAGLPITARRNHSLVVSYYNDPQNGNPGTDATIYDPNPDFKFMNDTGNWLLWKTEMDTETGLLAFTLWGASDGRVGYYSPPQLLRQWPAGDPVETYTTDLAPGERECQSAHYGAQTTFTYTRELADGTKEETEYPSYYRALPQICLVGAEPGTVEANEEETALVGEGYANETSE